jgi:hypothetical protein
MAHPEILRTLTSIDDPVLRFVAVTKFYLSGWHIKPPWVDASVIEEHSTNPALEA